MWRPVFELLDLSKHNLIVKLTEGTREVNEIVTTSNPTFLPTFANLLKADKGVNTFFYKEAVCFCIYTFVSSFCYTFRTGIVKYYRSTFLYMNIMQI